MDFDSVNRYLTLIANFAVVAGIVFLAYELRQNSQQLELQSYQSWVEANMQINTTLADPELSAIVSRGHADSRNLSSDSYIAYAMAHMSMLQMAQSAHYLYLSGALDKELWEAEMNRAAGVITLPGVRQWWDAGGKTQLSPSFVEYLESIDTDDTTWAWDQERGFHELGDFKPEATTGIESGRTGDLQ